MARDNRVGMVILVCFLGALAGVIFAQLLIAIFPGLEDFFMLGVDVGFDLHIIRAGFRCNVAAILGIIAALLIWRRF
ncbi:MAG: hypothetical protein LBC99_00220 [Spirochaetota bacterium]|jgi:hypothetical protein|nr:hypothetical protein [Spirochaetota bacterium]